MKNKIKKLFYLLLVFFVFVLTSCSSDSNGDLGGPNEPGNNVVIETTRKIYYTVNYSIESNEYDEIKNKISAEVGKYNGYVQSSSDTNNFSEYVYKVPTEVLNSFLDYIDSFGNDVLNKNVQSMDITTEYSDIEARKEVLTASRQSYLNLLSKEDLNMTEIITIQNKISEIDSELASIIKKLNYYDNLLDYSTITIQFYGKRNKPSFSSEYFSYLSNLIIGIGQIFLYVLPFILLVGIIVGIIIFINYNNKRKRNKKNKKIE